ncbi:MAG: glucosamine-6-phosphate deaminase [Bacteroidota bacterium]|nr:glucosamine-6-phosphate deaminase [Bacteroidota bacterium]
MIDFFKKEHLEVKIYESREALGKAAAHEAADKIRDLLSQQKQINIVFAAAPSQNEFLEYLAKEPGIDWNRINGFHMDEYIGLSSDSSQSFGHFLKEHIFDVKPFLSVNLLNGQNRSMIQECERYGQLIKANPIDIVCMGIGENGHIAFNDPHVADFKDQSIVKFVCLDNTCRQQQVNDGCFKAFQDVPTHAFTLTIPALMSARHVFCMVPNQKKALAVSNTIEDEINERCPATILRTHKSAILYLDSESSELLLSIKKERS